MKCPICKDDMEVMIADNHETILDCKKCHVIVEMEDGEIIDKYIEIRIDLMNFEGD